MSFIQQYCRPPTNASSPRPGGPICGDALIWLCPPRFKKHAENITIYLQCLNRLKAQNAAVFEKQVLMFDKKKKDLKIHVQSLSHCYAHVLRKPFTKFVHKDLDFVYRDVSQGLNGKDAVVLGKQVLMFDEKKI